MKRVWRALVFMLIVLSIAAPQPRPKLSEEEEWKTALALSRNTKSDRPKGGLVPDAETARRIAEAVATSLYGETVVVRERPFRVRLHGNVWTVMGTLPPLALGGVVIIQVRQDNGCVVFAHHTQ